MFPTLFPTATAIPPEMQATIATISVGAIVLVGLIFLVLQGVWAISRERKLGVEPRSLGRRMKDAWSDFFDALRRVEEETEPPREGLDGRLIGVVVLSCVMLTFLEYYGASSDYVILEKPLGLFVDDPKRLLAEWFRQGPRAELYRLTYWALGTFFCYFVIPAAFIKIVLRDRVRDYGLKVGGLFKHTWIYVLLYIIVLPAAWVVSYTESFQKMYPFYDDAGRSWIDFVSWELVYALQFFSLEFFFRGFMIHGTKHRYGYYAILVSVVPYCMIHFGKPMPETLGAILAGLALGTLSLFSRSIWLGVLIHVSVAISMDLLSLAAQGKF